MAAAAKNSEPMIALSRELTGKAWDSKPPISPGKTQQTMPATAKTMTRMILIGIAAPPYFHPTFRQARGNKVRSCCFAKTRCHSVGKSARVHRGGEFWFKKELTGGHLHIRIGTAEPTVRTRKHRGCVMLHRRRSVPYSFEDQIPAEKAQLEEQVADLPYGPERDALLRKIRQFETASHMNEWLNSPGLRPPE